MSGASSRTRGTWTPISGRRGRTRPSRSPSNSWPLACWSTASRRSAHREIIHANGLDSTFRQIAGGFFRDVHELFLEGVGFPVVLGVLGPEENALALLQMMRLELLHLN